MVYFCDFQACLAYYISVQRIEYGAIASTAHALS